MPPMSLPDDVSVMSNSSVNSNNSILSASVIGAEQRMKLLEAKIVKLLQAQKRILEEHEEQCEEYENEINDLIEKQKDKENAGPSEEDLRKNERIATLEKEVASKDEIIKDLKEKLEQSIAKQLSGAVKRPIKKTSLSERRAELEARRQKLAEKVARRSRSTTSASLGNNLSNTSPTTADASTVGPSTTTRRSMITGRSPTTGRSTTERSTSDSITTARSTTTGRSSIISKKNTKATSKRTTKEQARSNTRGSLATTASTAKSKTDEDFLEC